MSESGILDTNTVILLSRLREPEVLPEQPVVTAITLADKPICSKRKRISTRFPSTRLQLALSGASQPRCEAQEESELHGLTTR